MEEECKNLKLRGFAHHGKAFKNSLGMIYIIYHVALDFFVFDGVGVKCGWNPALFSIVHSTYSFLHIFTPYL